MIKGMDQQRGHHGTYSTEMFALAIGLWLLRVLPKLAGSRGLIQGFRVQGKITSARRSGNGDELQNIIENSYRKISTGHLPKTHQTVDFLLNYLLVS